MTKETRYILTIFYCTHLSISPNLSNFLTPPALFMHHSTTIQPPFNHHSRCSNDILKQESSEFVSFLYFIPFKPPHRFFHSRESSARIWCKIQQTGREEQPLAGQSLSLIYSKIQTNAFYLLIRETALVALVFTTEASDKTTKLKIIIIKPFLLL